MRVLTDIAQRPLTGYKAVAATLIGAAMTAACAKLAYYMPGSPVPVTMQVFAVVLCGMMLGSRLGAIAQVQYIVAGLLGAPVFTAGTMPGPGALVGPTGGYLIGFVAAAYVIGLVIEKSESRSLLTCCIGGLFGVALIHTCGVAWLSVWGGPAFHGFAAWALGSVPYMASDMVKVGAAAVVASGRR